MSEIKMTPERRAEARVRCDAATSGPWESNGYEVFARKADGNLKKSVCEFDMFTNDAGTMDFIARARTDLPDALDTIGALEEENAKMRSELDTIKDRKLCPHAFGFACPFGMGENCRKTQRLDLCWEKVRGSK